MIENRDKLTLKELIIIYISIYSYLKSKWIIIVLTTLIGSTFGVLYSIKQKPTYKATLSFALEEESNSGGGIGGAISSQLGLDFGGGANGIFNGANLIELFKSRRMVEQTLLTPVINNDTITSLAEMYILNHKMREKWRKNPKLKNIKFTPTSRKNNYTREQDSILGVIFETLAKGDLTITQKDKKIPILYIEISSINELFAKYFAEALAKEVSDFYIETKSKKARMNLSILERQSDSVRRELYGDITGVAVANDNTFNLNPALNIHHTTSAQRQIDVQANTAILTELVKNLEMAKVTLRKETPLIQAIDKPILPLNKSHFGKIKGIIIGGGVSFFLILIFLVSKRTIKNNLN